MGPLANEAINFGVASGEKSNIGLGRPWAGWSTTRLRRWQAALCAVGFASTGQGHGISHTIRYSNLTCVSPLKVGVTSCVNSFTVTLVTAFG